MLVIESARWLPLINHELNKVIITDYHIETDRRRTKCLTTVPVLLF